jgi:hypothetical protein
MIVSRVNPQHKGKLGTQMSRRAVFLAKKNHPQNSPVVFVLWLVASHQATT